MNSRGETGLVPEAYLEVSVGYRRGMVGGCELTRRDGSRPRGILRGEWVYNFISQSENFPVSCYMKCLNWCGDMAFKNTATIVTYSEQEICVPL